MEIPKQLQNNEFRFVLLLKNNKVPFEKEWQTKNNYKYDDIKVINHKGNLGLVCGYGELVVLDIDDLSLIEEFDKKIDTFAVKTGSGGRHYYFICDDKFDKSYYKLSNDSGELRVSNSQVVCPGFKHPNGNIYEIIKDTPIKEITQDDLMSLVGNKFSFNGQSTKEVNIKEIYYPDKSRSGKEFAAVCKMIKQGLSKEEIFEEMMLYSKWVEHGGKHPQYREDTYNGALKAVKQEHTLESQDNFEDEKLYLTADELTNLDISEQSWLVEDVISESGGTLFIGSPKSSKSFLALYLAMCIASGKEFLGLEVKKGRVLYIDEENGVRELKSRLSRLMKGQKIESCDIDFMIFRNLKLQGKSSKEWQEKIKQYIVERKPSLVICDSIVRFMEDDENSAKDVREVFNFIKPFKEKTAWLFLHHTPKGRMEARGSGDWTAQIDDSFMIQRRGERFQIKTDLSRRQKDFEGFEYVIKGAEGEPLILEVVGEVKSDKKIKVWQKLAEKVMFWIKENNISQFRRKDASKKFNDPYSRMTDALNYLKRQGLLKNEVEGKYEVMEKQLTN